MNRLMIVLAVVLLIAAGAAGQTDTTFTYQGRLMDGGEPAEGDYNIDLTLWDAAADGNMVGTEVMFNDHPVTGGLMTLELDFGADVFDGGQTWLEISVNGTELAPRQPITRAPYAVQTRGIFVNESGTVKIGTTAPAGVLPDPRVHIHTIGAGEGMTITGDFGKQTVIYPGTMALLNEAEEVGWLIHTLPIAGLDGSFRIYETQVVDGSFLSLVASPFVIHRFAPHESLIVDSEGQVGIRLPGSADNADFDLHVNGSAGKPGGGSWSDTSDVRLKRNIENIDGALDDLLRLRGVTFEYADPDAIGELHGQRIGMIAQEVEQVFPDWVGLRDDGYKTVTYRGFQALTVEALRELRAESQAIRDEANRRIAELETHNERLRTRLDALEALIARER